MKLTSAQQRIADFIATATHPDTPMSDNTMLNVIAVAGSGKSLVIIEGARRSSHTDFLFLCHSRNVKDRAMRTLPANVTPRTVYEMAYRFVSLTHPEKFTQKIRESIPAAAIRAQFPGTTQADIKLARQTLKRFYRDTGSFPEPKHMPASAQPQENRSSRHTPLPASLTLARDIWFSQINKSADSLPLTFDAVIKQWTLSTPVTLETGASGRFTTIHPLGKHQAILLEEAQDSGAHLLNFITRQQVPLILFGDDMQALRLGDPSAMELRHSAYQNAEIITMQESHRFGQPVATAIGHLRNKAPHRNAVASMIEGKGRSQLFDDSRAAFWIKHGHHFTVICESHAALFRSAYRATKRGCKLAWIDGLESYPITLLQDLALLAQRQQPHSTNDLPRLIETPWLKSITSLDAAREYAHKTFNTTALALCDFVAHHSTGDLLEMVSKWRKDDIARQEAILGHWTTPPERDITLTNIYRAKGHEFTRVLVGQDLVTPDILNSWQTDYRQRTALNKLYTALSRGTQEVAIPRDLIDHLHSKGAHLDLTPTTAPASEDTEKAAHPYWGAHRDSLLEMTPANRSRRKQLNRPSAPTKNAGTPSGRQRIDQDIEQASSALTSQGIDALRAQLPLSRKRRQQSR